jgi:amino acid adenylation domain-containing protein
LYSPGSSSIVAAIAALAEEQPDAIAVDAGRERLTYAELDAASAAIAAGLRAAGCGEDEVVGVCLPRSWQAICAFVGVVRAGAAYVPVGSDQPPLRKRALLELAGARFAITDRERVEGLPATVDRLDVEALAATPVADPRPAAGGERLAYVLFTSGSTGTPKGVEITHANLLHMLGSGSALLPVAGDAVLAVAPIEFDIAALEIWGALSVGARIVLVPHGRPDPRAVGRLIAEREVSFAFFAAGLFEQVVRAALPDLGGMRLIAAGGDVMAPSAARAVRFAHPGVRVLNGYGPTETTIIASGFEVQEVDGSPLPIGKPLRGYEFHVLGPDAKPLPRGQSGELWIGGRGVARGYRADPERTRERFRPDPFSEREGARIYNSGDVVREREDGNFEFLGRSDHQVKISGHRIEPGEVEQALGLHPAVAQAAVVAREDVPGHKRLIGYAALREGAGASGDELTEHLRQRLPAYMLPAAMVLLDEVPLTERGKIDRGALPALPLPGTGEGAEPDDASAAIAELFAEVLGLDAVGPDDEFGALGGDSLLTIQLVGRIRDRLGIEADVATVFEARTPRLLAAALADAGANARPPLVPRADRSTPAPATFAQRRAWLFERINPDSLSFQFAALVHLRGELDEDALRAALGDLMRRHPVFRTAVVERDGEPVQLVAEQLEVPLEIVDLPGEKGVEWARLVRRVVRARIELERAPLVRWTLVRRGPGRWTLIDVEHHAAHDGWSFPIVLAEIAELYSARVEGREAALGPLPVDLGDLAAWERTLLTPELERGQLDYWRRTLDRNPALLELPAARARPPRESFAGGSVRRRLPAQLAEGVSELSRAEGTTAFAAGLAAFAVLLGRSASVEDVQIGTGLANRTDPAAERLVGMTVGTAALRIDLSGDPTVSELLRRTRATVLDAIANADVPFERVVEALAPARQAQRSPLIQTMFSFDDAAARTMRWTGLEAKVVQTIPNGTAKADLNVIGVDHGDGEPFFIWEHSDLLTDAAVDRLAGHHLALLEQFVAAPGARISELRLAGADELAELERWTTNAGGFDREASLPELVARQARLRPDSLAVVGGGERLTYAELLARARALAGTLRTRGVGRGDAVGILLPRSALSAVAPLAVLIAGAAYVPLDPAHPPARIGRSLADAGAGVALTSAALAERLPAGVEAIDVTAASGGEPLVECEARAEDLAYVMYTSGSTGEPKGVEVTHRNIARLVDDPGFAELGPGTVMLHAASPAFDATTLELWGPLANGGTVAVLGEQPSPDAVAAAIAAHGVTTAWLTAGLFHELVDRRPDCLGSLRHLLAGGDVLSPAHVSRALAALPVDGRLSNGYGPTETTTFALTHELRPGDEVGATVPLGRPIQGTVCEVLDSAGQPAPVGVVGELWIGGDGVARGYRGDPGLSAERFHPDPERPGARRYRSGDLVRRRPDGVLEFVGRADRQLKVRGVRVEPAEVERVLRDHAAVGDVAVVAYGEAGGERALAAYVVPDEADGGPAPAALRKHALARLPAAMVPTAWLALEALPLNANGKVDRARLPQPGREHLARDSGAGAAPRDEDERRVVAIFEAVLGVEGVGAEEDFFALGGHSLLAVALFTELEKGGGRRLPLATIFAAPTPRALAAELRAAAPPRRSWSNLVALKPFGSKPPLFAVTAGDGNVVGFGQLARELDAEQPLYALQPSGLDGQTTIDRGIEAMAAACVEEIRAVRPHGPYLLAGRCNGATVAYEIAQQLRRAGHEVPLLVALDSDPPPAGPRQLRPGLQTDPFMETAWLRARERGEQVPDREGAAGRAALVEWLRGAAGDGVSRYLHEVWHWREDLRRRWPDPLGADASALGEWAWESGVVEHNLAPALLRPALNGSCRPPGGRPWDQALDRLWRQRGQLPSDPLVGSGWGELRAHAREPLAGGGANRYLLAALDRADLRAIFPDPLGADLSSARHWAWTHGVDEGLDPLLLPPFPSRRPRWSRRQMLERAAELVAAPARSRLVRVDADAVGSARDRAAHALELRLGRTLPRARGRIERRIEVAAREARASYRAEPWPGRIVLVCSSEFERKPAYLAWPERAEITRLQLPLGHVEMLRDPGAKQLAARLDECIAAVL